MREISMLFYRISGIYGRIVRYMAFMYRYDSFLTPYVNDTKIKKDFSLTSSEPNKKVILKIKLHYSINNEEKAQEFNIKNI